MRFKFTPVPDWPPLCWMALCRIGDEAIQIFHGPRVETQCDWFCEAVWAGEVSAGDFDRTDLVFGSGGRVRDEGVIFVSSGATVDRLHMLQAGDHFLVSNSLACIMAGFDGTVDPMYPHYERDLRSIKRGLEGYRRCLNTSVGPVRFAFYQDLVWDGRHLADRPKPCFIRDFSSFGRYRGFLEESLSALIKNTHSADRSFALAMMGTISSGYDSPAIMALARPLGVEEAVAFGERSAPARDGRRFAEMLGVRPIWLDRDAWARAALSAVPFLAADARGQEVHFQAAETVLCGRVLLTGHHGDVNWQIRKAFPEAELAWPGMSGLSLCEYRLWAGFIHCPVPFMGVRQLRDIRAIGSSPDMAPWDIGGEYSRPIPRRILEAAGLPRDQIGLRKRGSSVWLRNRDIFWHSSSARDYLDWLRSQSLFWLRKGRIPPHWISALSHPVQDLAADLTHRLRKDWRLSPYASRLIRSARTLGNSEYLYRFLFPWALERAKERYRGAGVPSSEFLKTGRL